MSGIYGNMGEIARRLMELEESNARMKEQIRLLEQERFPRWIITEKDRIVLGKSVYGPIAKGTAGQFQVFEGLFPSEAGAEPLTGINRFGYIGYDKWLIAVWVERCQGWYIVAAEC